MKKNGHRSVFPKKGPAKPKRSKKTPGRPRLAGTPTYLRLDDETLRRVEARRVALQAQNRVSPVGTADVLRSLVRDGLDVATSDVDELREAAARTVDAAGLGEVDLHRAIRKAFDVFSLAPGVYEKIKAARLALCRLYIAEESAK